MENPEEKIKMPSNIYEYLYNENASIAGFKPNEIVPVQDLYYGMILPSGAECCISIAEHISESESKYVKKMNQFEADLIFATVKFPRNNIMRIID